MSNIGLKISKDGHEITDGDNDMSMTSKYDGLKIKETGTITASLSAETLAHLAYKTYVEYYTHNLTYVPFYTPYFNGLENSDYATTNDFIINNSLNRMPPAGTPSALVDTEFVSASIDGTVLRLFIARQAFLPGGGSVYFGAHDIVLNYTIFYNEIDEVVDYT